MNKQKKLICIIIAVAIAAVATYWYFSKNRAPKVKTTEEALDVLSATPPVTVETNPVKKVPSLNPVNKVNPFKTTNPFE